MTRFSPEYKAFILSDEAKCLRERWKPKPGDCYTQKDTEVWGLDFISITCKANGLAALASARGIKWLPTLTDLLGMIEEALDEEERFNFGGFSFRRWFLDDGQKRWKLSLKPPWMDRTGFGATKKIAAATLAVRVLTKGENG